MQKPDKTFIKDRIKPLVFTLLPLLTLFVLAESILHLAGIGNPFSVTLPVWDSPLQIQVPDIYCGFRLKPDTEIGSIKLNSLGFRTHELNQNADIKILCLGDSVGFGWGIHNPADTYAGQLEKILSEQAKTTGRTVAVFNAGIPSYQLYQGVQLYLHYLADLTDWDYVICSFGWNNSNDTNPAEVEGREDAAMLEYIRRNPPGENEIIRKTRRIAEQLHLYNALNSLYIKGFLAEEIEQKQYPYQRYAKLLTDFAGSVKRHNARPLFLSVQVREEDKGDRYRNDIMKLNETSREVAQLEKIPFIDTDPLFKKNGSGWFDNIHFDEKGHRITAEVLASIIARGLDLTKDSS
ncbi:MAG: SGNH/GDSL hydrolase family protein [Proteobacteria bacterium]|nr:SGNH/GDSL hydrolase family protein [Pseudomonadota bacterium]MBU1686730.1 SGNH/GDSL hydrolase family protein [Pseudomonadota bacterium]